MGKQEKLASEGSEAELEKQTEQLTMRVGKASADNDDNADSVDRRPQPPFLK